jgi:serine/threonine protein kinase
MGVVYRAEDLALGRQVAVKTLPRMSVRQSTRLRREARAIAAVDHPNLAMIYAVESFQRLPLLIFEYLGGGTLAHRIGRGRMPIEESARLGLRIADVVDAIHNAGILHRDIKPSNIGFSEKGVPKLLDFGLAKLLLSAQEGAVEPAPPLADVALDRTSVALSRRGRSIVGTPLYLSPEALRGADPDPSFDLWSLCVVLYEAGTGRHPFRADTAEQTIARILSCAFRSLDETLPGAPDELRRFFAAAFSRRASRRPGSVEELSSLLEGLIRAAA